MSLHVVSYYDMFFCYLSFSLLLQQDVDWEMSRVFQLQVSPIRLPTGRFLVLLFICNISYCKHNRHVEVAFFTIIFIVSLDGVFIFLFM